MSELVIKDLHVSVEGKEILKGIDLTLRQGETHALMGRNGSGKSTLASTLLGHPNYTVTQGEVALDGEDILALGTDQRARAGLFLAFQYPSSVPGVSTFNFLRTAYNAVHPVAPGQKPMAVREFRKMLAEKRAVLKMDEDFLKRYLNDGFSGGEKKKAEILAMAVLAPKFAILDETDSGLDVDALESVGKSVNAMRDAVKADLGDASIVVCNAVNQYQWTSVLAQPVADFESQWRTCTVHAVLMAKAFIPGMVPRKHGRFIAINTECTMQCHPNQGAYVSGKRGMDGVMRVLAREVGEHQITVNQVAPGWMISDKYRGTADEIQPEYAKNVALKRRGYDQDVANAVSFLASDLAAFISGCYLPVTGGHVMPTV